MLNVVKRVVGIGLLGGGTALVAMQIANGRGSDSDYTTDAAVLEAQATQNGQKDIAGDDVFATDTLTDTSTTGTAALSDEDAVARLGTGGLLGNENDLSNVRAVLDDAESDGAQVMASAADAMLDDQPRLRGLPETVEDSDDAKNADGSDQDMADQAPDAVSRAGTALPAAPAVATSSDTVENSIDSASTAPARIDPPLADVPVAQRSGFTRNRATSSKPDTGRYFTTNARRTDKVDDGTYFTKDARAPATDPCVKADGTDYVGPGTALNPFAATNPCVPKATAESFDVASDAPPVSTAADTAISGPNYLPVDFGRFTPSGPIIPPTDPVFKSDYPNI